jgi:hypothetical protein
LSDPRPQLRVNDRETRSDPLDEVADHICRQGRVDGDDDEPGFGCADLEKVCVHGVLTHEQDAIALLEPTRQESLGNLIRELVGLPVGQSRQVLVPVGARPADKDLLVRVAPGQALEDVADAHSLPSIDGTTMGEIGDINAHRYPAHG